MLKGVAKLALATRAGWSIASRLRRRRGVAILVYHRIVRPGDRFDGIEHSTFLSHMRWIASRCRPIWPQELSERSSRPDSRRRAAEVLVTVDDGFRDFHDNAYPILDELKIPSVMFLPTSLIDSGGLLWTDAVTWAVRRSARTHIELPWNGTPHELADPQARERCAQSCKDHLKCVRNEDRIRLQAELYEALGVDPAGIPFERQFLNWDEVRAMAALTTFGGHSHSHPILSQLDPLSADREIAVCTERIEAETGIAPRLFAYPNGRAQDFTASTQQLLRKYRYDFAFSTVRGLHYAGADPFAARRLTAPQSAGADFASTVWGR
jgi:peptidoglycan/xylan/chitin deacetylase (PgdA/CDA1 family)